MAIDLRVEAERLAALCNSEGNWNCPRPDLEQTCPNVYCDDVEPEHWLEILKREAEKNDSNGGEVEMTDNTSSGVLTCNIFSSSFWCIIKIILTFRPKSYIIYVMKFRAVLAYWVAAANGICGQLRVLPFAKESIYSTIAIFGFFFCCLILRSRPYIRDF